MLREEESWHEILYVLALKFFHNVRSNHRLGFLNYFVVFCVNYIAFNLCHSFHISDELFESISSFLQNSYLLVGDLVDLSIWLFIH